MDKQGEVEKIGHQIFEKGKEKSRCNKQLQLYEEEENRIKQECECIKQV